MTSYDPNNYLVLQKFEKYFDLIDASLALTFTHCPRLGEFKNIWKAKMSNEEMNELTTFLELNRIIKFRTPKDWSTLIELDSRGTDIMSGPRGTKGMIYYFKQLELLHLKSIVEEEEKRRLREEKELDRECKKETIKSSRYQRSWKPTLISIPVTATITEFFEHFRIILNFFHIHI